MKAKRILGFAILSSPFVALFIAISVSINVIAAFAIFGFVLGFIALICTGIWLVEG